MSISDPLHRYSQREIAFCTPIFNSLVKPDEIKLETRAAAHFFRNSGVSEESLHKIWRIANLENADAILFEGFCKVCRLISHVQQGALDINADLLDIEAENPARFFSESNFIAPPSSKDMDSYELLFAENHFDNYVPGTKALSLFQKSGVSKRSLAIVWDLSDVDEDGKLSFGEFVIAMTLISHFIKFHFLPETLPTSLEYLLNIDGIDLNQGFPIIKNIDNQQFRKMERDLWESEAQVKTYQEMILKIQGHISILEDEIESFGPLDGPEQQPIPSAIGLEVEQKIADFDNLRKNKLKSKSVHRELLERVTMRSNERVLKVDNIAAMQCQLSSIQSMRVDLGRKLKVHAAEFVISSQTGESPRLNWERFD